ncbi:MULTISPECIES: hypothetical protein [unclassified Acinetobacter]|uniref:hypothetical protein n=1 Tax=unclassified Acinetobacter TaxID=196816 RepID=UPI0015D28435|nr:MULTISPECIES: hypothetical protein [unclassified Acinetobacter]UUS60385.1 hypothetical protein MST17_13690 [Acinetobacter sp. YH16056_T]
MALQPIQIICNTCHHTSTEIPTRSFLGFQKLSCPHCQAQLTYPLTSGFRTTYAIFAVLIILSIMLNLSQGQVGFPGLIGIAMIYALVRDWQIRKQLK